MQEQNLTAKACQRMPPSARGGQSLLPTSVSGDSSNKLMPWALPSSMTTQICANAYQLMIATMMVLRVMMLKKKVLVSVEVMMVGMRMEVDLLRKGGEGGRPGGGERSSSDYGVMH